MINSPLKKVVWGAGACVVVYVPVTFSLMLSTHYLTGPMRMTRAEAACARAWKGNVANARVTAAYQGTAHSFLNWIGSATLDAGTIQTVQSEGTDPMAVCYVSASSFPLPNIPGGPPYNHIVAVQDEKTGWGALLVGGHNDNLRFP